MIKTDYLVGQIQRLMEGLVGVRQQIVKNELKGAEDTLDELLRDAEALLEDADAEGKREVRTVLAQIHSEKAMVRGASNDLKGALGQMEKALAHLEPHVGEGVDKIEHLYDTTLLNIGAMNAAARNIDAALARLDAAITRLRADGMSDDAPRHRRQMWMGALKNRATAREQKRDIEGAIADYEAARTCAKSLSEAGQDSALTPLVNISLRLAALKVPKVGPHDARGEVEAALAAAKVAVEKEVKGFETLYIRAKVAMADACFGTGDYAAGEDHIFAAIDTMPQVLDTLLVALDFYTALWSRSDEQLEAGGLPRDEVGDSYAELLAKLDAISPDKDLTAMVRARYDLVVNERMEPAAAYLKKNPTPDEKNPFKRALHAKLQQVLRSKVAEN